MIRHLISTILILCISLPALSQEGNWLAKKIRSADTVLLVSHEATAGDKIIDEDGNEIPSPKLTIAGKPNYNIVKERKVITDVELDTLKDLKSIYAFDDRKWKELEDFFIKLGFTYELVDTE